MAIWRRFQLLGLALVMALAGGAAPAGAAGAVPQAPVSVSSAPDSSAVPARPAGCNGTAITIIQTINKPIPDAAGTPGVLTITFPLSTTALYVWDVNVTLAITHTFSGDLELTLISPHGTRVTLSKSNGGSLDNLYNGVTFDDQAGLTAPPGPVTLAHYVGGTGLGLVNPQEPLSAFNGENPSGTWTLEVRDNVPGDTGVAKNWTLNIDALNTVPATFTGQPANGFGVNAIPDGHGLVDVPLTLNTLTTISALTVTTVITHGNPHDLVVELVPPSGLTLTLSSQNPRSGGPFANAFAGTTWIDQAGAANAPGPVTDNTFASGTHETPLAPQEALAEVNGTFQNGTWHLRVRDMVTGTAGTLGRVSLTAASLTCLPALTDATNLSPRFPRLGRALVVNTFPRNLGATAHDVLQVVSVVGPYAFQSASGPDWSCAPLPVGTLSPTVDCVRASLPQSIDIFNPVEVTVTAPLIPQPAGISVSISASVQGLISPTHSIGAFFTSYASSANGNPWDLLDGLNTVFGFPPDSGSIRNGGQDAFFDFGQIHVRALDLTGTVLGDAEAQHLNLTYTPGHRWQSLSFAGIGGLVVRRSILAPAGADWLRYVDSFQNLNASPTQVVVSWGGQLLSTSHTQVAATSSGNLTLAQADNDTWAVTRQQDAPNGPAVKPPVGLAFRSPADASYQGPYVYSTVGITQTAWPSLGNGQPGQVFKFVLQPNETRRLAYFLARGLAEGVPGPADCDFYGGCITPAAGSQVALIEATVAALAANPPFCDLSPADRATLINWPGISTHCLDLPLALR